MKLPSFLFVVIVLVVAAIMNPSEEDHWETVSGQIGVKNKLAVRGIAALSKIFNDEADLGVKYYDFGVASFLIGKDGSQSDILTWGVFGMVFKTDKLR